MPPHARALLGYLHRLTSPTPADAALLEGWMRQRDESAFAALVARHGPMVLGVARRVLGDVQHAEDVFQATFLVLARHADKLRRPESLPGYLHGVALRLAKKSRGAARHRLPPTSLEDCEPVSAQPHPLDVLSGRELLALIDEEVSRLPEVYRLPVLLCVVQGRPVEEAARRLGWGVGSVRGRLARGRERLRQRLARRGLTLSMGAVGLLGPAALPGRLLAQVVRNLSDAPSAIDVLASTATAPLRRRLIGLGVLLAVIGLGVGLPLLRAPAEPQPPADKPAEPERAKEEPRRDRHGDPLPPGAVARLGTLRFRFPNDVEAVAFAPDGKTLAVSAGLHQYLMDATTGERIRRLPAEAGVVLVNPLVFSPDGKRLIGRIQRTGLPRSKTTVRVWDLTGEEKPTVYETAAPLWVGWSPEGEPLAVFLEDRAVRLEELATGRSRRFECKELRKPGLKDYVACSCAPVAKSLAVADEHGLIHVWDSATGRERCTLRPRDDFVRTLAFTPDGKTLASLTRQAVQLWDPATGKELPAPKTDQKSLHMIAFAPDGRTLVTVSRGGARCWDVATGREVSRTQEHYDFAATVAFAADGKTLLTAEHEGPAVHLWDVATGKQHAQPEGHRAWPHGVAVAPDGRRVATGGSRDCTIHVWDLLTSESLVRIHRPNQWLRSVTYSPDGSSVFSAWLDDNLWVCSATTGERQHVLKLEDAERPDSRQSAISMYPSADGKTLVAFSHYFPKGDNAGQQYDETLITGWDTFTRKQLFRRRRPTQDSWFTLSPDARVLAAPDTSASTEDKPSPGKEPARLEDLATGEVLMTFSVLGGQTWPQAFSPDGRYLAALNMNWKRKDKAGDPASATGNALHLWETATAAEVLVLPAAPNNQVVFSPDGRLLAVTVSGPEILVWDLARGHEWRRLKGFDAYVTSLAFAPDGRLISGLSDSTFLVWDVGTLEPPGKLGADAAAKAWADLAGADGARALRAHWALAGAPEEAVPLLQKHLRPARAADARQVQRLLAELDSEQFELREKAQAALAELGDLAEPALREALKKKPALDVHRRVQAVLDGLRKPVTQPESLRTLRGVGVLETVGTAPARQLLQELAAGVAEARLTREARAALTRLGQKSPPER